MRIFLILTIFLLMTGGTAWAADAVPAPAYFPVLPMDAPSDTLPQWAPVAANHPLQGSHPGVTRAIIVIHDETRDANNTLATMTALAGAANESVLILAPQYLLPSDLAHFAYHLPEQGRAFAAWQMEGWAQGDDAMAAQGQKGVSSFTVVDLFLMYLTERQIFPDLQTIIIAGYGAGGNFVQRYAAFSAATPMLAQRNIDVRYLVADARSYLYMTSVRPLGGRKGFGQPDLTACQDYNAYPYGLDKMNGYTRHIGANAAKTDYATRFVTYLNAPASDIAPEASCAALTQGNDNATRAANYRLYLHSLYSDAATRTQKFVLVKDAKNDFVGLFGSSCGMEVLFGDGLCPSAVADMP